MKRVVMVTTVLAGLVFLATLPLQWAGSSEIALLDSPRGAWIATVRGDAPLTVLEERSGWRRVRVEGWVAGSTAESSDPSSPPSEPAAVPSASAPPPPSPGPASVPAGAIVRGVLLPSPGDRVSTPGAGLIVLLVSGLPALDAEHAKAGEECRADLEAADARLEALRADYNKALNSTEIFREATARSDRLKSEIKAGERTRQERIDVCRRAADALLQEHARERAITDDAGRFEFTGVPPGTYRLVATEAGVLQPRAWALDCAVTGPGTVVLDPRKDASKFKPYWGLR